MKRNRTIVFLPVLVLICLCSCQKDTDNNFKPLAQRAFLTISSYYDESGSTISPVWQEEDVAGLFLAEQNSLNVCYASPLLPGDSLGEFLFTITPKTSEPQTLVTFFPSDGNLECEDGKVIVGLSANQTGKVEPCMLGRASSQKLNTYNGASMELTQLFCVMYITLEGGDYVIEKVEISSNGGEGIAGDVAVDALSWKATASEAKITVTPPSPINCRTGMQTLAAMVAPVSLSSGYTITLYDTDGNTHTMSDHSSVTFEMGGKFNTEDEAADGTTASILVFCGDNRIYIIDSSLADENGYKDAVIWSFNANYIGPTLGKPSVSYLDDCKPVDNNTKFLMTSSEGWCVLLDIETEEVLFYTKESPNAHSAELLPSDRIVVACSTGTSSTNNCLELYDISSPGEIIGQVALNSAHGAVWNETTQRLYAIGGQSMLVISLSNWDTASPSLIVERTISTPKSGLHDLTYVDSNTLCVSGNASYLYNIEKDEWTELTLFSSRTGLKSVNYNPRNGEVWYTDSTEPEGSYDWSTHTLRHAETGFASSSDKTIDVSDVNVYKVRVMSW